MAVHGFISENIGLPNSVGKPSVVDRTIRDHVQRILEDHDYIRLVFPEASKCGDKSNLKDEMYRATKHMSGQDELQPPRDVSDISKTKIRHEEQLPNEGIEASDLSSLLEQFLEYELALNQSTSLLTPATSPGCSEIWNEQIHPEVDAPPDATDLTPPTTPPVLVPPEMNSSMNSGIKSGMVGHSLDPEKSSEASGKKLSFENVEYTNIQGKRKLERAKTSSASDHTPECKKVKLNEELNGLVEGLTEATTLGGNESKSKEQDVDNCCKELEEGEYKEEISNSDVKEERIRSDCSMVCEKHRENNNKHENISQHEVSENTRLCQMNNAMKTQSPGANVLRPDGNGDCKKTKSGGCDSTCVKSRENNSICEEIGQGRRYSSRRQSIEDDSSDDERYDPRRCEQLKERYRKSSKYAHRRERQHDYHGRRSERDHRKYDNNSNREYNCDRRNRYGRQSYKSHWKKVRDIEQERKIDFRLGRSCIRDLAKEERRVVYVGGLPYGTTRDELRNRLRRFGPVEQVTVHLREGERDNYGFVTFFESEDARECIERGNSDPNEPYLDLCFGGRRQYCGGSYVDFDSKTSHIEELSETFGNIRGEIPEEEDFDSLLRKYEEGLERAESP